MEFPIWVSLVYFGTAAVSLLLSAVLYRANPGRGINQAAAFFVGLCAVWQFATGLMFFHPVTAGFYIKMVIAMRGAGVSAIVLMLAALRFPEEKGRALLWRTRWWWVFALVYAAPVFSPWMIPRESTFEVPRRGVLWVPYGVSQVVMGFVVLVLAVRAAKSLKGNARFTAQIICGVFGLLFVLIGLRFLLRPWLPPSGLVLAHAIVGLVVVATFAFAVLTRRVFRARLVLVETLVHAVGLTLALAAAFVVLHFGEGIRAASYLAVGVAMMIWTLNYGAQRRRVQGQTAELTARVIQQFEAIRGRGRHADGGVREALDVLLEWTGAREGKLLLNDGEKWAGDGVSLRVDDPLAVRLAHQRWATAESFAQSGSDPNAVLAGLSLQRLGGVVAVMSARQRAGQRALLVLGEKANGDYFTYPEIMALQVLVDEVCTLVDSRVAGQRGRALGRIEALEMLGASIGHDFKQHVAAVRLLAHRIGDRRLTQAETVSSLGKLEGELRKLGEFSRRLTKLGRPAPGGRSRLKVEEAFAAVVGFLGETANARGVRLRSVVDDDGITVWVNRERLNQALVNLAMNAIEAFDHSGDLGRERWLALRAWRESNVVVIEVADNGPGLSAEVLAHLFDPFVSEGKTDGDGLGLYLTWDAVTREGGEIRHEANVPHGTRFVMTFPD